MTPTSTITPGAPSEPAGTTRVDPAGGRRRDGRRQPPRRRAPRPAEEPEDDAEPSPAKDGRLDVIV